MTVTRTRPAILFLGVLGQALALRAGFKRPSRFWPLMTLGLVGSCLLLGPRRHEPSRQVDGRWIAAGIAAGVGAFGLTTQVAILAKKTSFGGRWLTRVGASTGAVGRPIAAGLIVPCAVAEELFWREGVLSRAGDPQSWRALWRATLLYGAVQGASLNPLPVGGGLLLGSLTGLLRQRSGSLVPAIAAHLIYSELTLAAPGLPIGGSSRDDPLTQP